MGILQKAGKFLGVSKFGQGLATTARVLSGEVGRDIRRQEEQTAQQSKILYAARQEKDPAKRRKLLEIAATTNAPSAMDIDPGLNLSDKEILGSAANVGLNILTPGAFKGSKAAIIGKNAALGSAFGAASGLEKNRSMGGVVGSAVGGAIIGGALGVATVGVKALKDFTTQTTPKWLMDKAIKPTLDEARKTVKYGQKTLGEELLKEGVKGSPKKLLDIADDKLTSLEDELQNVLNNPALDEARITRDKLVPYFKDIVDSKAGIPGLSSEVKSINKIINDIPKELTLREANIMKRRIYNEVRDVAYKLDSNLSLKGKVLKKLANALKQEIEKEVGGTIVMDINKKLAIYGRLENRIVDQMAKSMRSNGFGLTDAILTAGGIASMNPTAFLGSLMASGVRHGLGSTGVQTGLAQGLNKLQSVGTGAVGKTLGEVTRRGVLNVP